MNRPIGHPEYTTLGKYDPESVKELARAIINAQPDIPEELRAAYARIEELISVLRAVRATFDEEWPVDYAVSLREKIDDVLDEMVTR